MKALKKIGIIYSILYAVIIVFAAFFLIAAIFDAKNPDPTTGSGTEAIVQAFGFALASAVIWILIIVFMIPSLLFSTAGFILAVVTIIKSYKLNLRKSGVIFYLIYNSVFLIFGSIMCIALKNLALALIFITIFTAALVCHILAVVNFSKEKNLDTKIPEKY